MSSINSVRRLQILYFSKENKTNLKIKKWRKKVHSNPHLSILLSLDSNYIGDVVILLKFGNFTFL